MVEHEALTIERRRRMDRDKELNIFIEALRDRPLALDTWDEKLWVTLVGKGIVRKDGSIAFTFKNGTEIEVEK